MYKKKIISAVVIWYPWCGIVLFIVFAAQCYHIDCANTIHEPPTRTARVNTRKSINRPSSVQVSCSVTFATSSTMVDTTAPSIMFMASASIAKGIASTTKKKNALWLSCMTNLFVQVIESCLACRIVYVPVSIFAVATGFAF